MKCVRDNPEHRLEAGMSKSYLRFANKGRHPTFQKTSSAGLTELQFRAEPASPSLSARCFSCWSPLLSNVCSLRARAISHLNYNPSIQQSTQLHSLITEL